MLVTEIKTISLSEEKLMRHDALSVISVVI